jgi:hypothetical protein
MDLIIAAAHADIHCAALLECPGKHSFVTGGGWFLPGKQHFAVAGRDGEAWGHVMWKPTGLHIRRPFAKVFRDLATLSTELKSHPKLTKPSVLDPAAAFEGAAILWWTADGTPDAKIVGEALAIDMGEPGRSDFFAIAGLDSSGELASNGAGPLSGGNVQMHGKCSATGA